MSMTYSDPLDVLLGLQRALEARLESDWLRDATTSMGPFPPINIFQQGENFVAIIELPGIDKNDLQNLHHPTNRNRSHCCKSQLLLDGSPGVRCGGEER